eukprot:Opistho-2@58821
MPALLGKLHRCGPVGQFQGHAVAVVGKKADALGLVGPDRICKKRGRSQCLVLVKEQTHTLDAPIHNGELRGRHVVDVGGRAVGALSQQRDENELVARLCSHVHGRVLPLVRRIDVGPEIQNAPRHCTVPRTRRKMKGRVTIPIPGIDICPQLENELHNFGVSGADCDVYGRLSVLITPLERQIGGKLIYGDFVDRLDLEVLADVLSVVLLQKCRQLLGFLGDCLAVLSVDGLPIFQTACVCAINVSAALGAQKLAVAVARTRLIKALELLGRHFRHSTPQGAVANKRATATWGGRNLVVMGHGNAALSRQGCLYCVSANSKTVSKNTLRHPLLMRKCCNCVALCYSSPCTLR